MKTSELINRFNKNRMLVYKNEQQEVQYIKFFSEDISNKNTKYIAEVCCSTIGLYLLNGCTEEIMIVLMEYHKTPLEEREEEKKYRLKSKLLGFDAGKDLYLIYSNIHEQYCLASNLRQSFTQEEINTMPFDTNFFIKEEVQ